MPIAAAKRRGFATLYAMTLALILLLVALTAVLGLLRLRRSARTLCVLTVLLTAGIGWGVIPGQMLQHLEAGYQDEGPQAWQPRAVIIILGGGLQQVADTRAWQVNSLVYSRIVKGVELYVQCRRAGGACVLLLSGGVTAAGRDSEAKIYAAVLEKLGVAAADIALEANSLNTWQNARFCAAWLQAHPQDQVVLVTSGVHVRRSLLYFAHFGVRAQGVRADYMDTRPLLLPQAANFFLADLAAHEYAGLARYHIYNLFGWNVEAKRSGAL